MSKTLFDLTYELARALGIVSEGTATGGAVNQIADTVERTEADDFWNGGTAWVLYDAAGAGTAPQGEYGYISDFANTGGVVTLRSNLTAAVVVGDKYAIARIKYPLQLLIQKINEVLSTIPIEKDDTTTVDIAADQLEYSLPSDVWQLKKVWLQRHTGDSDTNEWSPINDWHVQKSATGTANKLILERQFDSDVVLKLAYLTNHQTLRSATDKLDDTISAARVLYNAVVACLVWRKAKTGTTDTSENELLNYYQNLAQQINQEFAVEYPRKSAKTIHPVFDRP